MDWAAILSQPKPGTGEVSALGKRLAEMSEAELLAALSDIERLDFPNITKWTIGGVVAKALAAKNPEAALTYLVGGFDDPARGLGLLRETFGKWQKDDPPAAVAWLDRQIATGNLDGRGINGLSRSRAELEGLVLSVNLANDPAEMRRRVEAMPDDLRFSAFQWTKPAEMGSEGLRNFANLVRGSLSAENSRIILGQAVTSTLILKTYAEAADAVNALQPTADERRAVLEQNPTGRLPYIYGRKMGRADIDEMRGWFTAVAPAEDLAKVTGRALANNWAGIPFDQAAGFALDYDSQEMLATFLETGNPGANAPEVRALAEKVIDPDRRARILRRLDPNYLGP